MKLRTITFTGADDQTSQKEMKSISRKFGRVVEWGILFSKTKIGTERYPSQEWIDQLDGTKLRLSAHLCGDWASEALIGRLDFDYAKFKRIQLNLGKDRLANLVARMNAIKPDEEEQLPVVRLSQLLDDHELILGGAFNELGFDINLSCKFMGSILCDGSGGRGKLAQWVVPKSLYRYGFAGGLNPDNLADELKKMDEVIEKGQRGIRKIWIDFESGVRTNGEFDLDKVRRCLEIAKPYA